MRTREQELEFQVRDIFNEFYKEKMEGATSFILEEDEINGMLEVDVKETDKGKFYHDNLNDEIFYKFIRRKNKFILIFIQLEIIRSGCCSWESQHWLMML